MNRMEQERWIIDFYKERKWFDYDAFQRLTFLMEEVGELAQAVRSIEIGRDRPDETEKTAEQLHTGLLEELGDVYINLLILTEKYQLSFDELVTAHRNKLFSRFHQEQSGGIEA